MISATPYNPSLKDTWDAVVKASSGGTFLLLRNYMDYHSDRFADASLLFADDRGRYFAVLPANRVTDTLYSHQGLTYGGLIYRSGTKIEAVMECFEAIVAWAQSEHITSIVYKPTPHIYHRTPCDEDLYALYRIGAHLRAREISSTIDLHSPLKWSTLRLRQMRSAMTAGVQIRPSEDYEAYWQVLTECLQINHNTTPVHTHDEIALLHSRFPDNIRLIGAYDTTGRLLAGTVLFVTDCVIHAQYISASPEGKAFGALDLLFHNLLTAWQWAEGIRYFDFGKSTEDEGRWLNAGLVRQKQGFGARAINYDTYEVVLKA